MSLDSRLTKIEELGRPDNVVVVWRDVGESADAAIARWMAERPGAPDPRGTSAVVHLIGWMREPQHDR
jgi:hypothetical protein